MDEQFVVVYDDGRKVIPYTTVYDDHESTRQLARCRQAHGMHCNARTVTAAQARRLAAEGAH